MTGSIFSAEYPERRARVPRGTPLVVALMGVSDAGSAIGQVESYLWERYAPEEVVRFSADELLDYRARRPVITFDKDHLVDYSPEELTLSLAHDELGAPFLLLSGFEPDFRWEQFVDTVLMLVHEFEVSTTVWTHAIPMPVPHTRAIRSTVSGSRDDLISDRSVWRPTTKLAASAAHVLEYRLHSLGEDVVGFALLIPHYLANTDYPDALRAALDGIMSATGLFFSTDEIRERADEFRQQVDEQIGDNEESLEMVRTLETRYDQYMQDQAQRSSLVDEDGGIPTAEQLASELETFLARHRDQMPGDPGQNGRGPNGRGPGEDPTPLP